MTKDRPSLTTNDITERKIQRWPKNQEKQSPGIFSLEINIHCGPLESIASINTVFTGQLECHLSYPFCIRIAVE